MHFSTDQIFLKPLISLTEFFFFFLTFVSKAGIIVWVLFHTPTPLFIHSEIQNKPIIDNVTCHLRYP